MKKFITKAVAFFASTPVHRAAAAVAVGIVGVQGFIGVHGVDFGLDTSTVQTVIAVLSGAAVVDRELVSPSIVPAIKALFTTK